MKKLFTHRCSGYLGSLWLVKEGELFEELDEFRKEETLTRHGALAIAVLIADE